jgi:hypothetical protein
MFWFSSSRKTKKRTVSTTTINTKHSEKPFHENPDHQWKYYKNLARRELVELMDRDDTQKPHHSTLTISTSRSVVDSMEEELRRHTITLMTSEESDNENENEYINFTCEGVNRVPFVFESVDFSSSVESRPLTSSCSSKRRLNHSLNFSNSPDSGVTPTPQNSPRN